MSVNPPEKLPAERENVDAKTVDQAVPLVVSGQVDAVEKVLLALIANVPHDYVNMFDLGDELRIKFWDQRSFMHYVTWHQSKGTANRNIVWIGNAYPRAFYYLGFINVKRKRFDRAIEFLNRGQALEPTNPKFALERAQALVHSGRREEALKQFDQISQVTEFVGAYDLAMARRGRGFVLIEMGLLDEAEKAFRSSLEIEPNHPVALNELQYIQHKRGGGASQTIETVQSGGNETLSCVMCGKAARTGQLIVIREAPAFLCKRCAGKLTKKWWQFWK